MTNSVKMTNDAFADLVDETLTAAQKTLCAKSAEYSRGGDKLHNFNRGAAMLGTTPERALIGMKLKHDISVLDLVDDIVDGRQPTRELIDEKIGDSINYLLLLKACLVSRLQGGAE